MGLRIIGGGPVELKEMVIGPPLSADQRAAAAARTARFDENCRVVVANYAAWRSQYPGEYVCVAAGEAFFDPTGKGALTKGYAAHPDERGVAQLQYLHPPKGL